MSICQQTTRLTLSPFEPEKPGVSCFRPVDLDGRHIGEHQGIDVVPDKPGDPDSIIRSSCEPMAGYDRLVTWDAGGASSQRYAPDEPNTNCRCARADAYQLARLGHRPQDHRWTTCNECGVIFDATRPDPARCVSCSIWLLRVEEYARGERVLDNRRGMGGRWSRTVRPHGDNFAGHPRLYTWSHGHGGAFGGLQVTVTWDDGDTAGPADFLWDGGAIPWWLLDQFPANGEIERGVKAPRPGHTDPFGRPLTYTGHP